MPPFIRSTSNPILISNPKHPWESFKVYNPGAILDKKGVFHIFYRAVGDGLDWHSSIGHAVSFDGESFIPDQEPLLTPRGQNEKRGLEDPRLTKIDDIYYMVYAAYDGQTPRLSIATSKNLKKWERHGPSLNGFNFETNGGKFIVWKNNLPVTVPQKKEWSKSGAIFPKKINGLYWMLFGEYQIWLACSADGLRWNADPKPFISSRTGNYFDNTYVEMGPPPTWTDRGWLVLYHGINEKAVYSLGAFLLDPENPRKILARTKEPLFWPEKKYELSGLTDIAPGGLSKFVNLNNNERSVLTAELENKNQLPKVIFVSGSILNNNSFHIYYGAGDSCVCTAKAKLRDILIQL